MKLNKGDFVEVLDDSLSGEIIAIDGDVATIETEDGFPLQFSLKELVKTDRLRIDDAQMHEAIQEKQIKKQQPKRQPKRKERKAPPLEVDLHIHHLVPSERNLSNFEMLNIQLDTARSQLEFAIRKRIQRVVFIHGVGEGVLRAELETLLSRYEELKFYDADFQQYGVGATEVYIFQNPRTTH